MKIALLATLASTILTAQAAENFGSVRFHSSVPSQQVEALKVDLQYLYSTPVSKIDQEFIAMAQMPSASGPQMHNWIVNRVRHIVGESFQFADDNFRVRSGYVFPRTAMPDLPGMGEEMIFSQVANPDPAPASANDGVKTIMTNLGGALYLTGKVGFEVNKVLTPVLLGLVLDGVEVYATSPRVGILKVGEGLFYEKFNLNPNLTAPANSINRLSTLFHEARHSDGNGKSTSFAHALCPRTHAYGGHYACEKSSNGPYSIGALSTRALLQNCQTCSIEEKTALAVSALDSFDRILSGTNSAYRLLEYQQVLKLYQDLLVTNTNLLLKAGPEQKKLIEKEIAEINMLIAQMRKDMADLEKELRVVPQPMDATPEGYFVPVSLEASARTMVNAKPNP